jgi:TRAP-type C4-dicarboxylate transport system permease small subunit
MENFSTWFKQHYNEPGLIGWIAFCLEAIAVTGLFALMVLTCVDVGGRYLFSNAVDGAVEITQFILAIVVFTEMPVVTWRGGHVLVDLLDGFVSQTVIKVLALVSALIVSTSFYVVAVRIWQLGERQLRRGVVSEFLELPVGYLGEFIAIMSWFTAAGMITYGIYRIATGSKTIETSQ